MSEIPSLDLNLDRDDQCMIKAWKRRTGQRIDPRGRNSKLNNPTLRRIETLFKKGVPRTQIYRAINVERHTFKRWERDHPNFADQVGQWESEGVEAMMDAVTESGDPRATVALLKTKDGFRDKHRMSRDQYERHVELQLAKQEAEIAFLQARARAEELRAQAIANASDEIEALLHEIEARQKRKRVIDVDHDQLPAPAE